MKLHVASFVILCLVLAAIPGWGDYDNGPINGTTDAWTINFGYIVSDTFFAPSEGYRVLGFSFGVWEYPGDVLSSVQWSVTSTENATTIYGSGTAQTNGGSGGTLTDKFLSINQYGYDIDLITVSSLNVPLSGSGKYWLNLQNATVPSGDPVYWDENSGKGCNSPGCPSQALQRTVGTIPSEAFTANICNGCACLSRPSGACMTEPGGAPEPSGIVLFGSGVLGLAGLLRCKLRW